ncbi:MAG TPA: class I SAM-dependent methyltransferase [Chryseosolibacter sp.]
MKGALDRFNWIARHYDRIARVVFGKAIYNSQISFTARIPSGAKILIVGGGSGAILPRLMSTNPDCSICYVDASSEMLALAADRVSAEQKSGISFIHGTEHDIPEGIEFEAVITNFFLDLFPEEDVAFVCAKLFQRLRQGGLWLVSDFVDGGEWWQRCLLWTMYRFFTVTGTVAASRLPAWQHHLEAAGLLETASRSFYGGFIRSVVYEKSR